MNTIEFLKDYFNEDEYFIITQKYPKIDGKVKHHQSMVSTKNDYLQKQLNKFHYLNKDKDVDIYFTLNTYKYQKSYFISRKEEMVQTIKAFYFDIDKGNIEQKKEEIIKLIGQPTYIIESSKNKFQFIYKFKEAIIATEEYRIYFKQLLKALIYHFDVDKTFDCARIFRLVDYMNKKQGNGNFKVTIKKFNQDYTFEYFEQLAQGIMIFSDKDIFEPKTKPKTTKTIKQITKKKIYTGFEQFKTIKKKMNKKYNSFLSKYNNDKSTADLAYAKWLRMCKNINDDELIIKKIFEARGYLELMEKHSYQIEYYFNNILEKSK